MANKDNKAICPKYGSTMHPIIKGSRSGDERKRKNIIKYGPESVARRPTTTCSNRDELQLMKPAIEQIERKKYNLKVRSSLRVGATSDQPGCKSVVFMDTPSVMGDNKDKSNQNEADDEIPVKENMKADNDVLDFFSSHKYRKGPLIESTKSLTEGRRPPKSFDNAADSSDEGMSCDSTETLEVSPLTISDTEECDTDLENELKEGISIRVKRLTY